MAKLSRKYKKYIRPAIGIFILAMGIVFMFFPFIPLGYVFIAAALILLSYELPPVRKALNFLKKKDNGKHVEKIEHEVEEVEEKLNEKLVDEEGVNKQDTRFDYSEQNKARTE